MKVVVTSRMAYFAKRLNEPNLVEDLKNLHAAMGAKKLTGTPEKWVIMARSSLVDDFAKKGVVPDRNDSWVWSQWKGYLEQDSAQKMKDFFQPCRMEYIHSSGHASPELLQQFAKSMKPKIFIPVHGDSWQEYVATFENSACLSNGQWVTIT